MLAYVVWLREQRQYFRAGGPNCFSATPDRTRALRLDTYAEARALARALPVAAYEVIQSDAP